MDHGAIKSGLPLPPPSETAIQSGSPPLGGNGSAAPLSDAKPTKKPAKHPLRIALEYASSLRITVVLFSLSLLLVFWGTLAQTDHGNWTIVERYFRSLVVLVPLKVVLFNQVENTDIVIPFPGGTLLGFIMLANLLAAHAIRFKLAWNRAGILMIHAGLIILMLGEFITGLYAVEGSMIISVGQTVNSVIHPGQSELAVVRTLNPKEDEVVTVPAALLKQGQILDQEQLPFKVEVLEYMVNSKLVDAGEHNLANKGFGRSTAAQELKEASGVSMDQRHNQPSVYVKLIGRDGADLGSWLLSSLFEQPQWIEIAGNKYQVALRFKQRERRFGFHLNKFEHKTFPGAPDKARDFHSYLHFTDPEAGVDRDVEIYMNAPFRYEGETFYQQSWITDPRTGVANGTILQVVRNPGWTMPYIACAVVGFGMLIHFGLTLRKFIDRRIVR